MSLNFEHVHCNWTFSICLHVTARPATSSAPSVSCLSSFSSVSSLFSPPSVCVVFSLAEVQCNLWLPGTSVFHHMIICSTRTPAQPQLQPDFLARSLVSSVSCFFVLFTPVVLCVPQSLSNMLLPSLCHPLTSFLVESPYPSCQAPAWNSISSGPFLPSRTWITPQPQCRISGLHHLQ